MKENKVAFFLWDFLITYPFPAIFISIVWSWGGSELLGLFLNHEWCFLPAANSFTETVLQYLLSWSCNGGNILLLAENSAVPFSNSVISLNAVCKADGVKMLWGSWLDATNGTCFRVFFSSWGRRYDLDMGQSDKIQLVHPEMFYATCIIFNIKLFSSISVSMTWSQDLCLCDVQKAVGLYTSFTSSSAESMGTLEF